MLIVAVILCFEEEEQILLMDLYEIIFAIWKDLTKSKICGKKFM